MRVDLHQHLWPQGLVEALRRRTARPRLDGWTLHLSGEPPYQALAQDHDLGRRVGLAVEDGVDLVGLSLSPALGVEQLPPDQAEPLLDAWHEGAQQLGPPFGFWVSAATASSDAVERVRRDLARPGALGLQLPAAQMLTPSAVSRLGPLFAEAARVDRPVLVHPGALLAEADGGPTADLPSWWPAVVGYVGQLHAAWHAWQVVGSMDHPDLRIAFVALAGLAPVHHERRTARGGPLHPIPTQSSGPAAGSVPLQFYETSSYGPAASAALTAVVGADVLVHGSDRPNATPSDLVESSGAQKILSSNPLRLLKGVA